jgi:multiple sugar transport system substrate-binding protein
MTHTYHCLIGVKDAIAGSLSRRAILCKGLAAIAAVSLTGSQTFAQASELTLRITHGFQGQNASMIESVVSRFQELHPEIRIDLVKSGDRDDTHFQNLLRSGVVNDLPDVAHIGLTYARELVDRDFAKAIDDVLGTQDVSAELHLPALLVESATYGDKVYAVPFGTTVPVVYYNLDLLKQAGVNPAELPTNWDEVTAAAKAVSKLGGTNIGGYIEYTAYNAWMFQNLLASNAGAMVNDDETDIAFDSPAGLEALRMLAAFGESMNADMSQEQARQAFNAGAMGVLIRSASGLESVSQAANGNFELAVGSFPVATERGHVVGGANGIVVFTDHPDSQAAVQKYIRFLVGPEGQSILAKQTGYVPVSPTAVQNDEFFDTYYDENPLKKSLLAGIATTSDWYSFPRNSLRIFEVIVEEMRKVVTKQVEPEAALATMATETRRLMKQ